MQTPTKYAIYQIKHKIIPHCYIGVTKNWSNRFQVHKAMYKTKNTKLYDTMKRNGGLDCYEFMVLEEFECENRREAEKYETQWIQRMEEDKIELLNSYKLEMNPTKLRKTSNAINYYYRNRKDILKRLEDKRRGINPVLEIHATEPQDNIILEIIPPL